MHHLLSCGMFITVRYIGFEEVSKHMLWIDVTIPNSTVCFGSSIGFGISKTNLNKYPLFWNIGYNTIILVIGTNIVLKYNTSSGFVISTVLNRCYDSKFS